MHERRALFKKSSAKGAKIVNFRHVKACDEACVEGRLESKLLKKDPTGAYSIGVNVFVDANGNPMKFSSTGKRADRFDGELEVILNFLRYT